MFAKQTTDTGALSNDQGLNARLPSTKRTLVARWSRANKRNQCSLGCSAHTHTPVALHAKSMFACSQKHAVRLFAHALVRLHAWRPCLLSCQLVRAPHLFACMHGDHVCSFVRLCARRTCSLACMATMSHSRLRVSKPSCAQEGVRASTARACTRKQRVCCI